MIDEERRHAIGRVGAIRRSHRVYYTPTLDCRGRDQARALESASFLNGFAEASTTFDSSAVLTRSRLQPLGAQAIRHDAIS